LKIVKTGEISHAPAKQTEKRISEKEVIANKLLKQIRDWKDKGYDTALLEAELQGRFRSKEHKLSGVELKKLLKRIQKWKSEGYDTLLLEKEIEGLGK
jgi:uncharacterized protein YecE (DUF72 family)